jgi:hypothetical protein
MNEEIDPAKNIFFYDGECAFCTHLASKLKSINQNKNLQFVSFRDFDSDVLGEIHPQLTEEILEGEVQLIYEKKTIPWIFCCKKNTSLAFDLLGFYPFFVSPFDTIYWNVCNANFEED